MNDQNVIQPNSTAASLRYTPDAGEERDSAKVLLMGGVAAGLVSGLLVLLTEREKQEPQTRLEQARQAIEEAAAKAKAESKKTSADASSGLAHLRGDAKKKGRKAGKDARKRGSRLSKKAEKDADQTAARISGLLAAARQEVAGTMREAGKRTPDVSELASQLRSRTDSAASDAKSRGRDLKKQAGKDAEKAKGEVASLVDTIKAKAADAEKIAESYVESSLLPKLKDFEKEAAGMIGAGKDKTKDRAQELRKQAEKEIIPQAKDRAEQLLKHAEEDLVPQARETVDKLKVTLGEQAEVAAQNLEKGSADAAKKLGEAREQAGKQAKETGDAVKRGGRETRSLLIWLGLAGAIVYNVFLNDDQQKKVRELGAELLGEAKEMYTDMKGDNGALSA